MLYSSGSYIYTGGYECVLAKWRYETTSKDTLPRLGSPIRTIACSKDNNYIATCHDCNGEFVLDICCGIYTFLVLYHYLVLFWFSDIKIISSQFKLKQNIVSLTRSLKVDPQPLLPIGLQYDPRTKCLVTNGLPGHVQFYDLFTDKHLYNVGILRIHVQTSLRI